MTGEKVKDKIIEIANMNSNELASFERSLSFTDLRKLYKDIFYQAVTIRREELLSIDTNGVLVECSEILEDEL